MNHHVPDFDMEDDSAIPSSSSAGFLHNKSSVTEDNDIVELVWQNGQIVLQNQKSHKKSLKLPATDAVLPGKSQLGAGDEIGSSTTTAAAHQLFIQEDEMASWLHYPIVDESFVDHRDVFGGDLLYPGAPAGPAPMVADGRPKEKPAQLPDPEPMAPPPRAGSSSRPPLHPSRRTEAEKMVNFTHFSRGKGKLEYPPLDLERAGRESTVVDSNETPAGIRVLKGERSVGGNAGSSTCGGGDREVGTCEQTMTSSSGGSGASAERLAKCPPTEDRKRKGRQGEESECQSEDAEYESMEEKKIARRSARKARAAEVHNLSERRRRDRINEKMKALQELIPRCNKSDKASMLDEAIEYLKSLQLQIQMMSVGCSMAPMMFPGVQQFMPPMGMGVGMGMGMSMNMEMATGGLSRPMMPFQPVLPGTGMPGPSGAHLGPRLPIPGFHLPHISSFDLSRVQTTSQPDPALNSAGQRSIHPLQSPNLADPYQHYLNLHHMQVQPQNQAMAQPSTSKGAETPTTHEAG